MDFSSFNAVSRVVHGWGSIQALPEEFKRLGLDRSKVLIVSDAGIASTGILDRTASILSAAGFETEKFTEISNDPPISDAEASVEFAKRYKPGAVLGIGGGSSLDIAKLAALMPTNSGTLESYLGMDLVENPGIPLILMPTAAGTGSEVTNISVLSDPANNIKKAVVSRHSYARAVLLDPELSVGLPPKITAMTGMDALVHATESFVGKRATLFTDALNIEAIRVIGANLRQAYSNGQDQEARTNMMYASCMAGMAFSNTQNGLDHALALAIGGRYHLPHGLLTAFICPWVMEFNMVAAPEKFARIALALGVKPDGKSTAELAEASVDCVRSLLSDLNISTRLGTYDVPPDAFADIARGTVGAARLISNNPRDVTEKDVVALLEANY